MLRVALRRSTQTGILRTINNSRQRNAASASERTRDATADTRAQENHQQNITSNVQVDLPPPPKKVPIKIPSLYAYFSSSAKERQFFHDQWRLENPPPERGPPDIDVLAQNLMTAALSGLTKPLDPSLKSSLYYLVEEYRKFRDHNEELRYILHVYRVEVDKLRAEATTLNGELEKLTVEVSEREQEIDELLTHVASANAGNAGREDEAQLRDTGGKPRVQFVEEADEIAIDDGSEYDEAHLSDSEIGSSYSASNRQSSSLSSSVSHQDASRQSSASSTTTSLPHASFQLPKRKGPKQFSVPSPRAFATATMRKRTTKRPRDPMTLRSTIVSGSSKIPSPVLQDSELRRRVREHSTSSVDTVVKRSPILAPISKSEPLK